MTKLLLLLVGRAVVALERIGNVEVQQIAGRLSLGHVDVLLLLLVLLVVLLATGASQNFQLICVITVSVGIAVLVLVVWTDVNGRGRRGAAVGPARAGEIDLCIAASTSAAPYDAHGLLQNALRCT